MATTECLRCGTVMDRRVLHAHLLHCTGEHDPDCVVCTRGRKAEDLLNELFAENAPENPAPVQRQYGARRRGAR